jgi:hypothetical protein
MSNRNFDSRTIIHRLMEQNQAQSLYRRQVNNKAYLSNPQTSNASPSLIATFQEGAETTYYKNLGTGYSISVSGITNLLAK